MAAGAAYLAHLGDGRPALGMALKAAPVLVLVALVFLWARDTYARLIAAGLVACALGDALLEAKGLFLQGLLAFLVGHLLYTAAFLADVRRPAWPLLLPFAAWGAVVWTLIGPGLGTLTWPVAAYFAAILTMMWRAAARQGASPRGAQSALAGAAGAVLFGLSDTLLALDRFRAPLPAAGLAILLLYWGGQVGIARSARTAS